MLDRIKNTKSQYPTDQYLKSRETQEKMLKTLCKFNYQPKSEVSALTFSKLDSKNEEKEHEWDSLIRKLTPDTKLASHSRFPSQPKSRPLPSRSKSPNFHIKSELISEKRKSSL